MLFSAMFFVGLSPMVPTVGLEPTRLSALVSDTSMSAIPSRGHIWRRGEYFTAAVCNPHWELRFGYPVLTRMTGPLGGDSGTRTHTVAMTKGF